MINKSDENIIKENIVKLLEEKFGNYSKYIILDRALPDIRDGLKPVQRRILFSMNVLKINHNSSYKKSARIVGEVIGKYHPHGDTSVYEAMVRMAQNWKMRYPTIDMHGNKGSVDGDPAAAMRYTEVRLAKISELLLNDLAYDTVKFLPNFDDNEIEPKYLPAKIPNLLMNGAVGIASGYSTNIPPHNLNELIEAVIYKIENPNAKVKDLMKFIIGPDFPTAGVIYDTKGIKEMYETGKGAFIIRGKYEIKNNIIKITELPFEVNKSELIKQIDNLSITKNLGIESVIDMTSKNGIDIEIILSSSSEPEVILKNIFKYTDLQKNYSSNLIAINNNKPKQFTLSDYIDSFIIFQEEIYSKKYIFMFKKYMRRLEIVEGLIYVISNIDAVIKIIRASKNKQDAKNNLINEFKISEIQAEAIVTLRLYRLTNTDIIELKSEKNNLEKEISEIESILKSKIKLRKKIVGFLLQQKMELGEIRRTRIENVDIESITFKDDELIDKKEVVFSITYDGYFKTMTIKSQASNEYLKFGRKENDIPVSIVRTANTNLLIAFTNKGRYIVIPIFKIKEAMWKDIGDHLNSMTSIDNDEKIISTIISSKLSADINLVITTELGKIKIINFKDLYTNRRNSIVKYTKLFNNDKVVSISPIKSKNDDVVIITEFGKYSRYKISEIPKISLNASGVNALPLDNNDKITGSIIHTNGTNTRLLVIRNDGLIKKIRFTDLQLFNSRTNKSKVLLLNSKSSMHIISAFSIKPKDQINIMDNNGNWLLLNSSDSVQSHPEIGSNKKVKSGVLNVTKNSFYDFSILETKEVTNEIKKIEKTIEIQRVQSNIKDASAKKEDKKVKAKDILDI